MFSSQKARLTTKNRRDILFSFVVNTILLPVDQNR
jgi:uncharacterized protein YceK